MGRAKKRSTAADSPIERLQRTAQRWYWNGGREGDTSAKAASRILNALATALRDRDTEALQRLEAPAIAYFERVLATDGRDLDPLASQAARTYEKIMTSIEIAIAPVDRVNVKRALAAQRFLIKAREFGFDLPAAPHDDGAVAFLLTAIEHVRQKMFDDDRARAEAWTRAMAVACGRKDAENAAKARMKQIKQQVKS